MKKTLSLLAILVLSVILDWKVYASDGFAAAFELEVISNTDRSHSSGSLQLRDSASIYLKVDEPTQQKFWQQKDRLTVVYDQEKLVMNGNTQLGSAPLSFDCLSYAITRLGDTPSERISLVESTTTHDNKVRQRWQLLDAKGKGVGEIHIQEGQGGVEMIAIVNKEGILRRRYRFGKRHPVALLSVPEQIDGEYFDQAGQPLKAERWQLTKIGPLPAESERKVGQIPDFPKDYEIREMQW